MSPEDAKAVIKAFETHLPDIAAEARKNTGQDVKGVKEIIKEALRMAMSDPTNRSRWRW